MWYFAQNFRLLYFAKHKFCKTWISSSCDKKKQPCGWGNKFLNSTTTQRLHVSVATSNIFCKLHQVIHSSSFWSNLNFTAANLQNIKFFTGWLIQFVIWLIVFLMKVLRKIPTQLDGVIRVRCDWSDETHGSFYCIPISLLDHRRIKDWGAFDKCQNVSSRLSKIWHFQCFQSFHRCHRKFHSNHWRKQRRKVYSIYYSKVSVGKDKNKGRTKC